MNNILTVKRVFGAAVLLNLTTIGIVVYEMIIGAWFAAILLIFFNDFIFFDIVVRMVVLSLISLILLVAVVIFGRRERKYTKNYLLIAASYGLVTTLYLTNLVWVGAV